MQLLLDQGVPRDTAALLRDDGFDCLHVGELEMSKAEDSEILAFAARQNATVITLDAFPRDARRFGRWRTLRHSSAHPGTRCRGSSGHRQKSDEPICTRFGGRLFDYGKGQEDNVPQAADRRFRFWTEVKRVSRS